MKPFQISFLSLLIITFLGTPNKYWGEDYHYFVNEILGGDRQVRDRAQDSLELVRFFNHTGGEDWKTPWNLEEPLENWYGLSLNNMGLVKCIDLDGAPDCSANKGGGNSLIGTMIDLDLPFLEHLFLAGNKLSGEIPNFSNLSNLLTLQLCCNRFTGSIPDFNNLKRLNSLELDYNQLSGEIPNFSNLEKLENLYISNNQLSGEIPGFDKLPNLKRMYLHQNQFTGSIPHMETPLLQRMFLSNNRLEGNLTKLKHQKQIQFVNLSNNTLEGDIAFFENFHTLVEVNLSNNQLSGKIPPLSSPYLRSLNFENNQIQAIAPGSNLPALKNCSLKGNCFSFEDLSHYDSWLNKLEQYDIQTAPLKDTIIKVVFEEALSLQLNFDQEVQNNQYKWFFNDQFLKELKGSNRLEIEEVKEQQLGKYYCIVSNPQFPGLTIKSRRFVIQEQKEAPPLVSPQAEDDYFTLVSDSEQSSFTLDLLENDDLSEIDYWDIQLLSKPSTGTISFNSDDQLLLQIPMGYTGIIDFEYELCNIEGKDLCSVGLVEIQIENKEEDPYKDFVLPGSFSPNDDGENDLYYIPALKDRAADFINPQLNVYSQGGQLVFTQKPYLNDWDGKYQQSNTPLPMGIYYYQFIWEKDKKYVRSGSLMLVK